jgi:hypothetical protein
VPVGSGWVVGGSRVKERVICAADPCRISQEMRPGRPLAYTLKAEAVASCYPPERMMIESLTTVQKLVPYSPVP